MFINNKYQKWYYEIVKNAIHRTINVNTYYETHHIIPRCLGGNNSKSNLVKLTAKEHFVCHRLLVYMVDSINNQYKMKNAVSKFMQSRSYQFRVLNSRQYQICREYSSECARYFAKSRPARTKESIQKGIDTNISRYGAGSNQINAVISDDQKQKMIDLRSERSTYDTWFVNANPKEKRDNHSKWAKEHSNFISNNPSKTEAGKRKISLSKSPGLIITPFGNFNSRWEFDQHSICQLIGFDTIFYMCNKLDGKIKTRSINRASLPKEWFNMTWREVGFNLILNPTSD